MSVAGSTLTIDEVGVVLSHGSWYGIRNAGTWVGVDSFNLHLVVAVGDANNNGRVLPADLSEINTDIPNFTAGADSRLDINGDGRVLPADLSAANSSIPSFNVPKPDGH